MPTLTARTISLSELEQRFQLQFTDDPTVFLEWQSKLPELTEIEKERCDRITTNYTYLLRYPPLLENTVKMVVLSPLLDMAGFFGPPFLIRSEASTEIVDRDGELTATGTLDVLVLCEDFWVLAIESKQAAFSLEVGRSQLLSYLLASPNATTSPTYGLLTNGGNFTFLKLMSHAEGFTYAISDEFNLRNRQNGCYPVLQILKRLANQFLDP
ncbi:restriction endonuclease subunit R [Spirulina sp. CS-785/01]|uniref:restriction endonuclease subunit R n=1 Tax=Spirulina sp. CS-785/01 TaxID=3021716 RepID=UPI00233003DF|nr:restriction endonuclease subunit R [Spirulina sp. CS-785/01]MDB9313933.1 restriction endonuclease subunit R [Spirulina sp. CS-785/01]